MKLVFVFEDHVVLDELILCDILVEKGERTFEMKGDNYWYHKKYCSDVNFQCDGDNNILIASVTGGQEPRTVGSYIEWILRNLDDGTDFLNCITVCR